MMNELATRVEKRFKFSRQELIHILITVVVAAFVLSFRKWGGDEFNLSRGLFNLIVTFIIVFVSFMVHFSAQKIMALSKGYESRYKYWLNGILISVILAFFSYGYFPLFFTGSLWYDVVPKLRVGIFRGGVKHKDLGLISFAGPFSNLVIVTLVAPVYLATQSSFFHTIIVVNLLMAVFSLLPIPTFEKLRQFKGGTTGLYLFIASRWIFILTFIFFLAYAVLILLFNVFSYIIALLIAIAITIAYYANIEK